MSKKFSIYFLVGTVALMGVLFFQVIKPFLFGLFCAAVLAVLFRPLYQREVKWLNGRKRVAAGLTTFAVLGLILLPIVFAILLAVTQLATYSSAIAEFVDDPQHSKLNVQAQKVAKSAPIVWLTERRKMLPENQQAKMDELIGKTINSVTDTVSKRTIGFVTDAISFLINFIVMVFALYYFFADGDLFVEEIKYLSPLGAEDQQVLLDEFEKVCRGVITGTILAALAQGVLAGIGFAIIGLPSFWLLAVVTMFFSFVPFMGAGVVWIGVCLWMLLSGHYWQAGFIAIYGVSIISSCDNVIKAYVIGGQAKLHPLVVLITVLGAIQVVGLFGIFIGPMLAAFFYALLKIMRERVFGPLFPPLKNDDDEFSSGVTGGSGPPKDKADTKEAPSEDASSSSGSSSAKPDDSDSLPDGLATDS